MSVATPSGRYSSLSIDALISEHEKFSRELSLLHDQLAHAMSDYHSEWQRVYASEMASPAYDGKRKSVAECARSADYNAQTEFLEVIDYRGRINSVTTIRDFLTNLITWKLHSPASPHAPGARLTETYPPDKPEV